MLSTAWRQVLEEIRLRPWVRLDSQGFTELSEEDADGRRLGRLVEQCELDLLDRRIDREAYEISVCGLNDYLRGEAWLGLISKERQSSLRLTGRIEELADHAKLAEHLTVESHGPWDQGPDGHPRYEYLVVRLRYASRYQFQLFCQILLAALMEIPV